MFEISTNEMALFKHTRLMIAVRIWTAIMNCKKSLNNNYWLITVRSRLVRLRTLQSGAQPEPYIAYGVQPTTGQQILMVSLLKREGIRSTRRRTCIHQLGFEPTHLWSTLVHNIWNRPLCHPRTLNRDAFVAGCKPLYIKTGKVEQYPHRPVHMILQRGKG